MLQPPLTTLPGALACCCLGHLAPLLLQEKYLDTTHPSSVMKHTTQRARDRGGVLGVQATFQQFSQSMGTWAVCLLPTWETGPWSMAQGMGFRPASSLPAKSRLQAGPLGQFASLHPGVFAWQTPVLMGEAPWFISSSQCPLGPSALLPLLSCFRERDPYKVHGSVSCQKKLHFDFKLSCTKIEDW